VANREIEILREVITKLAPMLAGKGFAVTQRGMQAYVKFNDKTGKPEGVNLPFIPDNASEDLILAVQGFLDHEVAHVLVTDWTVVKTATLKGPKWHWCWNVIEDTFIERWMGKAFPGAVHNIARLHEFFIEKLTEPQRLKAIGDDKKSFEVMMIPLMRAVSGQRVFQDYLTRVGAYDNPFMKAFFDKCPPELLKKVPLVKSSQESWELAQQLHAVLFPPAPKKEQPKKKDEAKDEPKEKGEQPEPQDGDNGESEGDEDGDSEGNSSGEEEGTESGDGKPSEEETDDKKAGAGDADEGEDDEPAANKDKGDDASDQDEEDKPGSGKSESSSDDDVGEDEGSDAQEADKTGDDEEAEGEDADGGSRDGDDQSDGGGAPEAADDGAGEDDDAGAADPAADAVDQAQSGEEDPGDAANAGDGSSAASDGGDQPEEESDDEGADGKKAKGSPKQNVGKDDKGTEEDDAAGAGEEGKEEATDGEDQEEDGDAAEIETEFKPSPFESMPVDIGNDFLEAIGSIIGDEALRATRGAEYTVFTSDNDVLEPYQLHHSYRDDMLPAIEDKIRGMVGVMQRDIERMMASRSQVIQVPGKRTGRLHGAALHRLTAGDDRVFRQRQENKSKDTAVSLLVDNSGSMSGRKMELAMLAAFALSQTLERVGVTHEVLGFTTKFITRRYDRTVRGYPKDEERASYAFSDEVHAEQTRLGRPFSRIDPIYMPIYRGFDERLTPTVKKRFADAAMTQTFLASNIDGECVQVATMRLLQRRESRKVLLVLSDGNPAGSGTASEQYSKLHDAVSFATKMGISCIGIGIMDTAVKAFYPKHLVLNDLSSLPSAVMGELRKILTA